MWYKNAKEKLEKGSVVTLRPRGHSMTPRIKSGQKVTLEPINNKEIKKNEIVLVEVKNTWYLHKVCKVSEDKLLIGNMHGKINGWTDKSKALGRVIQIEN